MQVSTNLRVGTMNVRSLSGRLGGVFDLAAKQSIDVVCLQETRVNHDSWSAITMAAKKLGWQTFPGVQNLDSAGSVSGGTLVFSKWPAQLVRIPETVQWHSRAMAIKLHRPGQRPLLLVNVYLHASNSTHAGQCLDSIFEWIAATGEDAMIVGDFNLESYNWPISAALASGRWLAAVGEIVMMLF